MEERIANHEVAANQRETEDSRDDVVAESEQVRQVNVGQRLDHVRIPELPGPEPVPSGSAEKRADEDERNPQHVEPDEEGENLESPLAKRVVAVTFRIDVEIWNEHQADDDEARKNHARVPRIEEDQHLLQAQKVPGRFGRIGRTGGIRWFLKG